MNEKLMSKFFDNIDGFNKLAISYIKDGFIDKAIEVYEEKLKYIRYSYEFNVISAERACIMRIDTRRVIDILSCEE